MNAYPVRLAAGFALIALCVLAEEPPEAKMAEPKTTPAAARKALPFDAGLNNQPVQLPTQNVDGSRNPVNQDLNQAFEREKMTASRALYQKALANNIRLEAFSPLEEGTNRAVALPLLRSSW